MADFNSPIANSLLPPQNIEAEEYVLGGILLDPEALGRIVDILTPDAFYVKAHRDIYQAALQLYGQGKPTDLMTVTTWLQDHHKLEDLGGTTQLARLVDRTISAVNIDRYAEFVMDKYIRRQLIAAGHEIVDLGYDTTLELEKVLDDSEKKIFNLTQKRPQEGLVPVAETLIQTYNEIEKLHQKTMQAGITCGFYDLDGMTNGFQRSDLIIVAGRPSMGKCCAANSELVLADGSLTTIEEIYRQRQAEILTLKNNWQFEFTQPSDFVDDGIKPVFRVTTKLGRFIETTITHPYLTIQGWQKLSDLKPGVKIAVPRKISVFGRETIPDEQVKLLAANSVNKIIPSIIFKLDESRLALFLKCLLNQDDCVTIVQGEQSQISYRTFSEKLARQLQHLLLRFGIIAILENKNIQENRDNIPVWQLDISESYSVINLINKIGLFGNKETIDYQENKSFQELANSSVYWDEIVSIEYVGEQQVYDLTIPNTHNFVANDICVHNTSFALNIAHNIAQFHNLPVAIFSLEMSKEQLSLRLLASEAKIDSNRLRSGRLSQNELEPLSIAMGNLSGLPIFIDDTANLSVMQMRSQVRRLQTEHKGKIGLVLLDYLQLMEGSGSENRVQELSRITRSLKGLAREINAPVMALSQLSRAVESRTNKRPMMSDLRESGSIEQDADLVLMLYRDEYYYPDSNDKGVAEVLVTKHRNGPTGPVKLLFKSELTTFLNMENSRF
jgi:replicative DNA helicase